MKTFRITLVAFLLTIMYCVYGQTNDAIVHTSCNKELYHCKNTVCDEYTIHVSTNGSYKECTSSHTTEGNCADKDGVLYASFDGSDSDSSHYDFTVFWKYTDFSFLDVNSQNEWFLRLAPCEAGDTINQYLDSVPAGDGFRFAWAEPDTTYVIIYEYDTIIHHSHTNICGLSSISQGNYHLFGSGYYAFRKPVGNGDYLYAWLRLSYECDTIYPDENNILKSLEQTIVVHDYAYCTIPNYPLRVGQTSLDWGVEENKNTFSLYPNPTTDKASIIFSGDKTIRQVSVSNLLGAIVLENTNPQGNTMDVSALPAGVYIVRIVTNDGKQEFAKLVKK